MNKKLLLFGIVLCFMFIPLVNGALTDGSKMAWTYDTNLTDLVGTMDGTATNAVPDATGKINGAYKYDGSGDYIGYGTSLPATMYGSKYTLSFWFQCNSTPTGMNYLVSREASGAGGEFHLRLNSGGGFDWQNYQAGGGSTLGITTTGKDYCNSKWQFVTMRNWGSNATLYINGSSIGYDSVVSATAWTGGTVNFYTGRYQGSASYMFAGSIDELTVWNRSLTLTEIQSVYNSGAGFQYPFSVAPVDSCTYSGTGNWIVTNNCNITSSYKVQTGYALIMKGTGKTLKISGSGAIR